MLVLLNSRRDINLDNAYRVAWQGSSVRITQEALNRIAACRKHFLALIEGDNPPFVYGVTTGYGQAAKRPLDRAGRHRQAVGKPLNQAVSIGDPLPERVTRAIVFARLANCIDGHAAVSPGFTKGIAAELDKGRLPGVPMDGITCGGEMNALAHVFSRFSRDYEFQPKEANVLTNGSPCAAALVADVAIAARRRATIALQISALVIEAFRAPLDHFDPVLVDLWQDPFAGEVIQALSRYLLGASPERRLYQAPVSYRIIPQILSQVLKATSDVELIATRSLSAVTDNPVYLPPDQSFPHGRCISNGGFHNALAAAALSAIAGAWADLCLLCERHAAKLLDGAVSQLPHWLPLADGSEPFRYVPWAILGLAEQARHAAQHTFLPAGEGAGYGQTDVASPVFLAWQRADTAGRCVDGALASVAVVALHALDSTGRVPPRGIADLAEELRRTAPEPDPLQPAGTRIQPVATALSARVYSAEGDRA